jgi:hypothetical protein
MGTDSATHLHGVLAEVLPSGLPTNREGRSS